MVKLKVSSIQSASVCVDKRGSVRGSEGGSERGSERGVNENIEEDKDKGEKRTKSSHTTNIFSFFFILFDSHWCLVNSIHVPHRKTDLFLLNG